MPSWLKKKSGADDTAADDSNRNALFGSRKEKAPAAANPYANPPSNNDRYANPPPAYSGSGPNDQFRRDKSPAVTGQGQSYGGGNGRGNGGGYSSGGGGYGGYGNNDRYGGGGGGNDNNQGARRPGGYGGLGRTDSNDTMSTDAGRNELFGGAAQRTQQREQQPGGYGQSGYGQGGQGGQSGAYGGGGGEGQGGGYGAYNDRELTAEEQEEEDISATKQEIRFMKQQDVSSTRNALRLAEQAEATGRDTLARLGAQGERIHNTERNLDMSSSQNRIAEEKARELKTLNKSMFAMHVANPFTGGARREERDRKIMDTHRQEREQRDATRKAAWESTARGSQVTKGGPGGGGAGGAGKSTLADRAKYQFEADSEDDEMENEIDDNLDKLHRSAQTLNSLSRAMGEEIGTQNKHIDRIIQKTDKVDDQIAMNRARLDRIN
ncbi:plasma membrane snare protein-like protein [Dendryphion nanum]|uniref:Plasma membrane snare protein-like protein n=1 Tax=Dendryphion nanum TaxID=256645 RepID=A0A9P9IJ27_9PLEO|nr:plasma membrane snare protein-like protein [Dendryphion nanum]